MTWATVLAAAASFSAIAFAYLTFYRNRKKDETEGGQEKGVLMSEVGYIKSGVDDIKAEQKEQRRMNQTILERLAAVEASSKQAHKRIDRLEGVVDGKADGRDHPGV